MKRGDTRTRLILAAEKLFGERGIHGVTLKEINIAAGQRNESALHYHFGSKPALVDAIMQYRVKAIDARRMEALDALQGEGREGELRPLLFASFMPMAELLGSEDGVRFIRFLAQVLNDPDFDLPSIALRSGFDGIRKSTALIIAALGDLPPEIAIQRQRFLVEMAVSSLAIWTRHHDAVAEVAARQLFIANLFDSIAGFLTAPVSPETLESLKQVAKKKEKK
jgi:AcrR family transcriptional regulator